jgi:hypothetical protein
MTRKYLLILIISLTASFIGGYFASGNGLDTESILTSFYSIGPTLDKFIFNKFRTTPEDKEACYYKEFQKAGRAEGAQYSFEILTALQSIDADAIGCHLIAHGIGGGSYDRDPSSWQDLISSISPACTYGAIHGVMEKYVGSLPEKHFTKELVPLLCGSNPRADCNHIVGHLLLVETNADIPEALDMCDVLQGNERQLQFCNTGVFMEYQTALNLIEHNLAPESWLDWPKRLPELEKTCRSYSGIRGISCWKEIAHAAVVKFAHNPGSVLNFCNTAHIRQGAIECKHHSIGILAAAYNFDLDKISSMCRIPQKNEVDFESACYTQLVSSTLSTNPKAKEKVDAFCESLSDNFRPECIRQVGGISDYFNNHND